MSGTVAIREATVEDARAIAEVHVSSWRWAYRDLLPATHLDGLSVEARETQWRETLSGADRHGVVIVAEVGEQIVGFASTGRTHDATTAERIGELFALYLVPEVVGAGVGRSLMARAEKELRSAGFTCATLWVLTSNGRGRRFYERAGWAWDGTTGEFRIDCGNQPMVRYARQL